jgi:hypothetical protein
LDVQNVADVERNEVVWLEVSMLVSDFDADSDSIAKPITPSSASDLGDR